jgi:hypothetical protein
MPHHPGASREVEESVANPNVALQDVLLLMLEKGSNSAMDDAFGSTRRTYNSLVSDYRLYIRSLLKETLGYR